MPEYIYSNGEHVVNIFYKMSENRPDAFFLEGDILYQKFDNLIFKTELKDFKHLGFMEGSEYKRVFTAPNAIIDNNKPKTIGALARKNTEEMVKSGKIKPKQEKEKPWWRESKKPIDISGRTSKEISNYVYTGKFK